ncbi:hypothetical protein X743_34375 [Mesorhizobium sp. LNHC252B00]|nr:hypothetical protein X743_34375 [Mesorhizobium sp. LNHC252B00]
MPEVRKPPTQDRLVVIEQQFRISQTEMHQAPREPFFALA